MIIIITIKMQFIIQNNDYAWQPTCPEPLLLPGRCCKVCPGQHDSKSSSSYKYKCKYELNNEKFIPNHTPSAPIHQFVVLFFSRAIVFFVFFHFAWGFYCSCSTLCRDDHHKEQLCFPNKEGAFSLHLLQQQHPSSRSDYFLTLPHHHPDRVAFFYYIALFCLFKDLPSPTPSKHSLLSNLHVPKMETTHFVVATSLILSHWTRLADFEQLDVR